MGIRYRNLVLVYENRDNYTCDIGQEDDLICPLEKCEP